MCGIVGVHYFDRAREVSAAELTAMNDQIVHRGPDDHGIALFGHSGIGMRRLSIIDLGGGHQPIYSPDGRQAIVFNGEAFNFKECRLALEQRGHRFSTHSDTEVVLHQYLESGLSFIEPLNGMFGLAIWDQSCERLLIARDRLGVKPIYYYQDADKLVYGSEIKSILAHPGVHAEIDRQTLPLFMQFGFTPAPHTLLKGIRKLPPGHMLLVSASGVEIRKYWDVSYADKHGGSADAIADELYALLRSAVDYRMIADVPLGAFLSGGLDSSSIVHMMRDLGKPDIRTYNIGYGARYAEHDESSEARQIARHYGTEHHEILAEPDVRELFPRLVRHLDEPLADSSFIVTYLVSQLASESVKVILSGVGGDELFGGYRRYLNVELNRWWQRVPGPLRRHLITPLLGMLPEDRNNRWLNYARLAKGFARNAELPVADQYSAMTRVLDTSLLVDGRINAQSVLEPFTSAMAGCDSRDLLERIMYVDLKTSLPEQLLLLTDKMSMACSIEVRVPYLDYRVVEFAARIPSALKLRGTELRHIQRRTFCGRVPDQVLSARKRGFGAPIGSWLRGDLREMIEDLLASQRLREAGLFNAQGVRSLIDGHMNRRVDGTDGLLALLTFALWEREFLAR